MARLLLRTTVNTDCTGKDAQGRIWTHLWNESVQSRDGCKQGKVPRWYKEEGLHGCRQDAAQTQGRCMEQKHSRMAKQKIKGRNYG